jgi:hypothetical protein
VSLSASTAPGSVTAPIPIASPSAPSAKPSRSWFAKAHQAVEYRIGNEAADERDDFEGKAARRIDSGFIKGHPCKL